MKIFNPLRRRLLGVGAGFLCVLCLTSAEAADLPRVLLKTTEGAILLELYPEKAPKSVSNFIQYVNDGHYNGTIFHRVINGFMIQGGGFDKNMKQLPTRKPIENEAANGLKNQEYTIAMARTSAPDSATSQFFINVANNSMLDYPKPDGYGYAVFGKVIKGSEIVDKIKQAKTQNLGMYQNVPSQPIIIESAVILK